MGFLFLARQIVIALLCRLTEELDNQQVVAAQHTHRLNSVLSALDELQERREVSDSARGRLRGILSAPLEQFLGGPAGGSAGVRSSGMICQSSRLSGVLLLTPSTLTCRA